MDNYNSENNALREEAEENMLVAVKQSINFEEDEFTFELPAGYVDENGIIHREFVLRELTGKDEEAIHKPEVKANGAKVSSVLLSRCVLRIGTITPKDVGRPKWLDIIKSLYASDQDYMMMRLREVSLGSEIVLEHECPHCKAKLRTIMDINELEIVPFNGTRFIDFELPKGHKDKKGVVHKSGKLRLPTGLDREILMPVALKNQGKAEILMLTRLCSFNDGAYVDEDVIGGLSIRDIGYLQKLLVENSSGIQFYLDIDCNECGETFRGSLNSLVNFM